LLMMSNFVLLLFLRFCVIRKTRQPTPHGVKPQDFGWQADHAKDSENFSLPRVRGLSYG
jgi:hypothetical protein